MSVVIILLLTFAICFSEASLNPLVNDKPIGDACVANLDCVGAPTRSQCLDNRCICLNGFIPRQNKLDCLPIRYQLGATCEEKDQCTSGVPNPGPYSDCLPSAGTSKTCQCESSAVPQGQRCYLKAVDIGDSCDVDIQCTSPFGNLSACTKNQCWCTSDAVTGPDLRSCLPANILIGDSCQSHAQCVGAVYFASECNNKTCSCRNEHIPTPERDDCVKVRNQLGAPCTHPIQCTSGIPGKLSECSKDNPEDLEMFCRCQPSAVHEVGGNACHKKAELIEDPCEILEQCSVPIEFSKCDLDRKQCECTDPKVPSKDKKKCLPQGDFGGSCEDDGQCSFEHSSCVSDPSGNYSCQCNPGYFEDPSEAEKCLQFASHLGDSCEGDENQCSKVEDSFCHGTRKTCECELRTHVESLEREKCLKIRPQLNATCEETPQCKVDNSQCAQWNETSEKRCLCREGYLESLVNPGVCMKKTSDEIVIGGPCENDFQCHQNTGNLTECRDFKCQCRASYQYFKDGCYRSVPLDGICGFHEECILGVNEHSICRPTEPNLIPKCRCISGAVRHEGKCYLRSGVGDSCKSHEECGIFISGKVYCDATSQTCTCLPGSTVEREGYHCSSGGLMKTGITSFGLLFAMMIGHLWE